MASYVTPKKNTAFITYVSLVSQADTRLVKSNATLATGDFKVSIDGGALANLATLPTVTPASGPMVKISLGTAEMNGDNITVVCSDASGAEWCDLVLNIQTSARQVDDLAFPATSGRSMVVDASGLVDANAVKVGPTGAGTAQTARDIGASVLLSSGAGAGQLDFTSGVVKANATQFASQTITAAAGVTLPTSVASPTNITAGTLTTVTNLTNAPTAGDFTSTMKTSLNAATPVASLSAADSPVVQSGTAQAGAGSAITLAAGASATDDLYKGALVKLTSGTGVGQTRVILSYVGATKVATLSRAWATNPDNTSVYSVLASDRPKIDSSLRTTDVSSGVVATNNDKTGYALTTAYDLAKTAAQTGDIMKVSNGTGSNQVALTSGAVILTPAYDRAKTAAQPTDIPDALTIAFRVWDEVLTTHTIAASAGVVLATLTGVPKDVWDYALTTQAPPSAGGYILDIDSLENSITPTNIAFAVWSQTDFLLDAPDTTGRLVFDNLAQAKTAINDVQSRLPSALISGHMDASVENYGSGKTPLQPTVAGRTLDVTAGGAAGVDWGNVENQTTAVALTSSTVGLAVTVGTGAADVILDRANGVETGFTLRQSGRLMLSALAGKLSGGATTTVVIRDVNDTKDRITATVDANGNRTATTYDLT